MKKTKIALIQMSCVPDTQKNLDHAVAMIEEAAANGAELICLPELFRAQYFCQREDHALFATPNRSRPQHGASRAGRERAQSGHHRVAV